jgi:eukaryotic-like serine/threonine-protein kinase
MSLEAGQTINRYQIVSLLGEGGMGSVYKAFDLTLQRDVAIKLMHAQYARQPDFQGRFLQEARTAARLAHPGIVQVHDFGQYQDQLYIVMEFIPGSNLGQILRDLRSTKQWIPLTEAVGLLRQVALSLDYAHKSGVLHRDIKPENIMLRPEPSDGLPYRPVVTDLGLAKLAGGGVFTQEGTSMGTPAYMSPEQALGQNTDPRSDVYSLGILLYELATGRLPFPARNLVDAIRYHTQEAPPRPRSVRPDLPEGLEKVILRTIEKDPARRFTSAGELASALAEALPAAAHVAEQQSTSLGDTVSLITQYQKSLLEPRGPSILGDFATPTDANQDRVQVLQDGKTILSTPLKDKEITIGRDSTNTLSLEDGKISRNHARIERSGSGYVIVDLNSTNGTFLNNVRLLPGIPEPWPEDQVVRVGSFWLRITRGSKQAGDPGAGRKGSTAGTAGPVFNTQTNQAAPVDAHTGSQAAGAASMVLENTRFSVAPGSSVTIPVTLLNQGAIVDHYGLSISGVPADWITGGLPRKSLLPGDRADLSLNIRPPRVPASRAGSYALSLSAVSETSRRTVATARLTLDVLPFAQFTYTLRPEKVRAKKIARLVLQNQGNTPETFSLLWKDRGDELVFQPAQTQVQAAEGQPVEVAFSAQPRQARIIGGELSHPFSVQIITSGGEERVQAGELVSRAIFPVWVIPALLGLCVFLAAVAGFAYNQISGQANARATQTQSALMALINAQTAAAPTATQPAAAATNTSGGVVGGGEATATNGPPTPIPTPTTPGDPTQPATNTPQPLMIKIAIPAQENTTVDKELVFRVQASDPAVGGNDGDGIAKVDMRVLDENGNVVHQRDEGSAGFCAFGGGEPDCSPWVFADHGYRWDNGDLVKDGPYTLFAEVNAKDGRKQTVEIKVEIHLLHRILYLSQKDGENELYTIYADGSGGKRLTKNAGVDCCLSFAPDGKNAAFTSKQDGNQEIYTVNLVSGKFKNLTNHPDADIAPVWSPDGKHIAFLSTRDAGGVLEVSVMNADGSGYQRLVNTTGNTGGLSWSPDGQTIAFNQDYGDGNYDIMTVHPDGSNLIRLTNDPFFDGAPAFSPDGGAIAFISSRIDRTFKPFIMGADGSAQTLLANIAASGIFTLWSPDGQTVYFPSAGAGGTAAIYRVAPSGAGLSQVTGNDLSPGLFSLSADGKMFTLMNGYKIFVVNSDGSQVKRLTNGTGLDDSPIWQP